MKNILCDQIRRWRWLWLASGIVYGITVWSGVPGKPDWATAFFSVAMFLGILPLSQDITHGDVPRMLRTLPVTAKQIGRAWWWASVGLPVLMLGLITALVFVFTSALSHRTISGAGCLRFWLSNALLFGFAFFILARDRRPAEETRAGQTLQGFLPAGFQGRAGVRVATAIGKTVWGGLCGVLYIASYFGGVMGFYLLFPPQTIRWEVFIAVATVLSIAGWFHTESFARRQLEMLPTKDG